MLQIIKLFRIKFPTIPNFQIFFTTKIDENRFWADFQGNRLKKIPSLHGFLNGNTIES